MEIAWAKPEGIHKVNFECRSNGEVFTFVPIGDIHWENRGCDERALKKTVEFIRETPNCRAVLMGDILDGIHHDDKYYHPSTIKPKYKGGSKWQMMINDLGDVLMPIRDKIIGIMEGNHDEKLVKKYSISPIDMLLDVLNEPLLKGGKMGRNDEFEMLRSGVHPEGVQNLGYCSVVSFGFCKMNGTRKRFNFWLHHGAGAGLTAGASINKIKTAQGIFEGINAYVMGHKHISVAHPEPMLYLTQQGKLAARTIWYVCVPSYLKNYQVGRTGDYAERWMTKPAYIGHTEISIIPFLGKGGDEHRLSVKQ